MAFLFWLTVNASSALIGKFRIDYDDPDGPSSMTKQKRQLIVIRPWMDIE